MATDESAATFPERRNLRFASPPSDKKPTVRPLVAVEAARFGRWLVLAAKPPRVLLYEPERRQHETLVEGKGREPVDIARDRRGRLLVLDEKARSVTRFAAADDPGERLSPAAGMAPRPWRSMPPATSTCSIVAGARSRSSIVAASGWRAWARRCRAGWSSQRPSDLAIDRPAGSGSPIPGSAWWCWSRRSSESIMRRFLRLFVLAAGALLLPASAWPQPAEVAVPEIIEEDLGEDVATLLAEAEEVFRSADQPESIPLFERIILLLERRQSEGAADAQASDWLQLARFRRAEARSNVLDRDGAAADLAAIVDLDPAWEVPAGYMVSRLFSELLDGVRTARTGVLDALIEPPDAELYLDGEALGPVSGPRRVRAGEHLLEVRRPGYTEVSQPLAIPPGESVPLELTLERTSAVVRLTTRPPGVEVVYRGQPLAVSEPRADGAEDGVSADLLVAGLEPGKQVLTFRRPGYRPVELRVEILELTDYSLDLVALEPTRGTVTLSGVPAAARVLLDGEPRRGPDPGAGPSELRMDLPPGPPRAARRGRSRRPVRATVRPRGSPDARHRGPSAPRPGPAGGPRRRPGGGRRSRAQAGRAARAG